MNHNITDIEIAMFFTFLLDTIENILDYLKDKEGKEAKQLFSKVSAMEELIGKAYFKISGTDPSEIEDD